MNSFEGIISHTNNKFFWQNCFLCCYISIWIHRYLKPNHERFSTYGFRFSNYGFRFSTLAWKNPVTFTSTIKLHTKNVLFIDTWGFRIWVASPGQMPSPKLSFLLEFEVLLQYYDSWNTWVYPAQLNSSHVCWKIDTEIDTEISSVAQSCPSLCNPMDCSTPGLPVHHQLLEFTQTHVHWVGDAIQLFHPLLSLSPPAFNLSQHQSLFKWVSSSHQVAKVLEFLLQHQSFQWIFRTNFL